MLHHNRLSNNLSTYNATLPKEYSTPKTYKWLKLPQRFLNIHLHGYVVMLTISNPLWKLSPFPSPLIPQLYIFIATPPLSEQSLVVALSKKIAMPNCTFKTRSYLLILKSTSYIPISLTNHPPCHLTSTIHYHPKKNPSTKEA